jgi:GAF domain-containing protein
MIVDGRPVGVLALTYGSVVAPMPQEQTLALLVTRHCARAVERLRRAEADRVARAQAEREQSVIASLYRLSEAVNGAETVEAVYRIALDAIEAALGVTRAAVSRLCGVGAMRVEASRQMSEELRATAQGYNPWSADGEEPQAIFVGDVRTAEPLAAYRPVLETEGIAALAFVPLMHRGRAPR